ncbi:MAG: hypothetical protein ACPLZF_00940 [Nitrososphaeria archaeon]
MFQIDVLALFVWSVIVVCVMSAVIVTYSIAKKILSLSTGKPQTSSSSKEREYFISIDVSDALSLYNQAQNFFERGEYKNVVQYCYNAIKDVFIKVLSHFNISPEDLNIVDMSYIVQVKGVRVSFIDHVQHANFIRLRMIVGQMVSKDEVSWMLKTCKAIIDMSKELPIAL